MSKIKKAVASVGIALALGLGGTSVVASTASAAPAPAASRFIVQPASSSPEYRCLAVGSTGKWYAHGFDNGRYVWSGPKRFFKTSAQTDCVDWLAGV